MGDQAFTDLLLNLFRLTGFFAGLVLLPGKMVPAGAWAALLGAWLCLEWNGAGTDLYALHLNFAELLSGSSSVQLSLPQVLTSGALGFLTAVVVNLSAYSAELLAGWISGSLSPAAGETDAVPGAEGCSLLKGLIALLMITAVLRSPFAGVLLAQLPGFVSPADIGTPDAFFSAALLVKVGELAFLSAAFLGLPYLMIMICADLTALLYLRYFRLGTHPQLWQGLRFAALIATLAATSILVSGEFEQQTGRAAQMLRPLDGPPR